MKLIGFLILLFFYNISGFAQLASRVDNSEYNIAQIIAGKAKQHNLGAIHSESPKMRPTVGKGGWFLRYEKGWVYYNPRLNQAFAIMENMMKKWGEVGYETGWMGFPISDNVELPKLNGFYIAFDNGSIYKSPTFGTHYIGGAFRDEWGKRGFENGATLGFPKTDEVAISINGYTRYQQFERGTLFFGNGKDLLYSSNSNATVPPPVQWYNLTFTPNYTSGGEGTSEVDGIDLYGWMDIRFYRTNGSEIDDVDGKSFSLFNIPKSNYLKNEGFDMKLNFSPQNQNFQRHYRISQADIDNNAYIRIVYWLNDYDAVNSNDYLKLQRPSGSMKYNSGNHPYMDIKLKEIVNRNNLVSSSDELSDGSGDSYRVNYKLTLSKINP